VLLALVRLFANLDEPLEKYTVISTNPASGKKGETMGAMAQNESGGGKIHWYPNTLQWNAARRKCQLIVLFG